MWRDWETRQESAARRLKLAQEIWQWTPHQAQEQFFTCPAPTRVAACGRRWGKTEALSMDIVTLALDEARAGRPCRQLIVAPTDAQARLLGDEVVRRLQDVFDRDGDPPVAPGLNLRLKQRPGLTATLRGANGPDLATILCRSAACDGRNLRGLWAHRILVDEASRVPDVVLADVLLPMLADKGGEYVLASSPYGRRSQFYRLWARGRSEEEPGPGAPLPKIAAFQCPSGDNPYLDADIVASWREEMSDNAYAQEIDAQFVDDFGAVFCEEDIDAAIVHDTRVRRAKNGLESDPAADRVYAAGIDWGRAQDFSVVCILDATETPARLVALRRWRGGSWDAQIAGLTDLLARFLPRRTFADGNSVGDPLIERLRAALANRRTLFEEAPRVPIEKFVFTGDTKRTLIDTLNIGLSARELTFPRFSTLLAELRAFEYGAPGSSGRAPMGARGSGHDDCVIALALAWYAAPAAAPPADLAGQIMLGSQIGHDRF